MVAVEVLVISAIGEVIASKVISKPTDYAIDKSVHYIKELSLVKKCRATRFVKKTIKKDINKIDVCEETKKCIQIRENKTLVASKILLKDYDPKTDDIGNKLSLQKVVSALIETVKGEIKDLISIFRDVVWNSDKFKEIIDNEDFQTYLKDILRSIQSGVEDANKKLDRVLEILEKDGTYKRSSLVPTSIEPIGYFVGREKDLKKVEDELAKKNTVYITGMGGIGKTTLCRQFLYQYNKNNPNVPIIWLNYNIGIRQTIASADVRDDAKSKCTDINELFKDRLDLIPKGSVVVIDNFETISDMDVEEKRAMDIFNSRGGFKRIYTTRHEPFDNANNTQIVIDKLQPKEAWDLFIEMISRIDTSDTNGVVKWCEVRKDKISVLLKKIDYHTLTITLVAGLINNMDLSDVKLEENIFNIGSANVCSPQTGKEDTIHGHIRELFKISGTEEKIELLHAISMTPRSGIQLKSFIDMAGLIGTEKLNELVKNNWLEYERSESGDRIILMHPLIREIMNEDIREKISIDDCGPCGKYLKRVISDYTDTEKIRPIEMIEWVEPISDVIENDDWAIDTYLKISKAYDSCGLYSIELRYDKRIVDIRENILPPDHPNLAISYNNIGLTYNHLGDYNNAMRYHVKALNIYAVAKPSHQNGLARTYNDIGLTYYDLGDYKNALDNYTKSLNIYEKIMPPDYLDLAIVYNNIGSVYKDSGDYKKALGYGLKALNIREKELPSDHRDLAISYNNIGAIYDKLNDREKSMDNYIKALNIYEKILPPDHPDLATVYNNIGSIYYYRKDYQNAMDYNMKALNIREKVLPSDHRDLAISYNNIGSTYSALNDDEKALDNYMKALNIYEKVLPPDHYDLSVIYDNIGPIHLDREDYKNALDYNMKALKIREKILPPDHSDLARSYYKVGVSYNYLGNHKNALDYIMKALNIYEKVLPPDHYDLATVYRNIGVTYKELGDEEKASEYMEKSCVITNNK